MIVRSLALILLGQLLIAAAIYWPTAPEAVTRSALIADIPSESVDQIRVTAPDGKSVAIERTADGWALSNGMNVGASSEEPSGAPTGAPSESSSGRPNGLPSGLPADSTIADRVLKALLDTDPGFALAMSEQAAERFEVSPTAFQRRIELTGVRDAEVFLGSSPAYQKIYARSADDEGIYVLALNDYDVPVDASGWLDKSLLAQKEVRSVFLYGRSFLITDGAWSEDSSESGSGSDGPDSMDSSSDRTPQMEPLIQALASLQVTSILPAATDTADFTEALRMQVGTEDRKELLIVLHDEPEESYFLISDRLDATFLTSAYDVERLIDAASTLLAGDSDADADADADASMIENATTAPSTNDGV